MELPVENCSPESARKSPEGAKVVENASTASSGEKVSEAMSSEDVTKEPRKNEAASEAEGTSGSGITREGEKSVTSECRETSPTRQEPPAVLEAEAAKIVPDSAGANELPEAREIRADPVETPIVEIAGKKATPPPVEASKSHSAEKSMTSGGSGSPEVGPVNLRDEDDETNDADDEVVEHDEEIGACLEQPEVGIVGPPTAVRDLVNDEELGTTESSSLPGDGRNDAAPSSDANAAPNIAEWIERSRLTKNTGLKISPGKATRRRKRSPIATNPTHGTARKSQKIVTNIIRRSIKCLNKMHAAAEYGVSGGGGTAVKKLDQSEQRDEDSRGSPKVPQSRQNGAALPEETAIAAIATTMANATVNSERLRPTVVKSENHSETENEEEEETTADAPSPKERSRSRRTSITDDTTPTSDSRNARKKSPTNNGSSRLVAKTERGENNPRKRRSNDDAIGCGQQFAKKIRSEQRERYIDSLVGTTERISAEELATRADELRAEVQALDELARAKEMEWNEILSMRKLKEEAYLRIERRRQIVGYMESNGQSVSSDNLPPASLSLTADWESTAENATTTTTTTTTTATTRTKSQDTATSSRDNVKDSGAATESDVSVRLVDTTRESQKAEDTRRERSPAASTKREQKGPSAATSVKSSNNAQRRTASPKQLAENGRKQQQQRNQQQQQRQQQQLSEQTTLDNRQIGEGRQGPIVDVRSIIADYRLRHPESVPRRYDSKRESPARGRETTANTRTSGLINVRRGRRMRNSVNIGLGAGGAMVETSAGGGPHHHHHHHHHDSRPSSTDSCKSSNERTSTGPAAPTTSDPNNSMSFKDVLVQFAKLSQQQGEPVKTPQNYPDVTLHPVAPTTVTINSAPTNQQTTGSLLHGILTKSQSPRPTTFSPTLARLLTAPERERTNLPTSITAIPQQNIQTQHLLQTYQGSNPVSISDLLSSSKARTEITITPVVTPITPGHVSQSNSLVHVDDVEEETSLIDERDSRLGSGARDSRDERDSPPRCQGCQERAAQFVCAGCGNQWYCSRDCQVAAWDDHSEVCSG